MDNDPKSELSYFIDEYRMARTYHDLLMEMASMARDDQGGARNWFSTFWLLTMRAYVSSMLLAIFRFFDSDPRSRLFRPLVNNSGNSGQRKKYNELEHIWNENFKYFRNKHIAHLDRSIEKAQENTVVPLATPTFAALESNEMNSLLDGIHDLLSDLNNHYTNEGYVSWVPYFQAQREFQAIRRYLEQEISRQRGDMPEE